MGYRVRGLAAAFLALCVRWAQPAAAAGEVKLTLRLRDGVTGLPTACRVHLSGPAGSVFASPDPQLRTHHGGGVAPFALALDSLSLQLPPALYQLRVVQGMTGIPQQIAIDLQHDTVVTLQIARWIDPREDGWIAGDPHTHTSHPPSEYTVAPPEVAAAAARAEGLEVMALLANDPVNPGGPVTTPMVGASLLWGEEFRSGYWGHVALLGLPQLVLTAAGPGCCDAANPAAPTLTSVLANAATSVAIIAHPHSTDDTWGGGGWPHTGVCRELRALALQHSVHGIAVASSSNSPTAWALQEYLDAVAAGARWAAVGESDMTLDRYASSPPGWARTYAWIDSPAAPGTTLLGLQWEAAVRAGRTFATQGPVVRELRIGGALPGETLELSNPGPVEVHLRAASYVPLRLARILGVQGVEWSASWPAGRTAVDTTFSLPVSGSDALLLELCALGGTWYAPMDTVRAVTTPVWIDLGQPWSVPAAVGRRGVDQLRHFWQRSLVERGYSTPQDSALARAQLLGAADQYEAMVDDQPGPFALLLPALGDTIPTTAASLLWRRAPAYDGEPTSYRVLLDTSDQFLFPQAHVVASDTVLTIGGLAPDQTYWWRVEASEPGEPARENEPPDGWFVVHADPVASPAATAPLLQLSVARLGADGVVHLVAQLATATRLATRWVDLRGRVVLAPAAVELTAGRHELTWNGRDQRGRPVAAGTYWLVAETSGVRVTRRVVLTRR